LGDAMKRAQGVGEHPWALTIIDYYGPGCMLDNGSREQIAMIPFLPRKEKKEENKE